MVTHNRKITPVLAAGASALAIAAAPALFFVAAPSGGSTITYTAGGPPGCVDPYGTGCGAVPPPPPPAPGVYVPPPPGVAGAIPGGPGGVAGPQGAAGA